MLSWRLRRQHLAARAPVSAWLDVVSDIAGLHAQLMASAELTLWARVDGLARSAVSDALWEERSLVKTWAMRGTLHLLPAAELPVWVAAQSMLKPRHHVGSWLRHWGLTRADADAMLDAIPAALGDAWLTREELAAAVARETGVAGLDDKLRGGFGDLLKPAAFRGDLAFAPSDGRSVRFVRPAAWLGSLEAVDPEEAARVVARRYLRAYGPATREAFARWFGSPSPAQSGRWLRLLGDELAETPLGLMLADDVDDASSAEPEGVVRLLPAFDHYVVAAPRDVEAVLAAEHRARVYRPQGWLSPVLLVDGVMAGVWSPELSGDRLAVSIEPFSAMGSEVAAAAEAEAARLAEFLGGEPDVTWQ